jgi:insertion element IS1 protein InsB
VGKKAHPRWLWHASDPQTGKVLASGCGRRQADVCPCLPALLEPLGITRFYPEGWGAYERHIEPEQHAVGTQHTHNIESTHLHLRTRIKRLVRRTIGFSPTARRPDLVIGLFVNR